MDHMDPIVKMDKEMVFFFFFDSLPNRIASTLVQYVYNVSVCLFIKVIDSQGEKSLALFPAKFQKSMWIKRGLFQKIQLVGTREGQLGIRLIVSFLISFICYLLSYSC